MDPDLKERLETAALAIEEAKKFRKDYSRKGDLTKLDKWVSKLEALLSQPSSEQGATSFYSKLYRLTLLLKHETKWHRTNPM